VGGAPSRFTSSGDDSPTDPSPILPAPVDLYEPALDDESQYDAPPPYTRVAGTPSPDLSPAGDFAEGALFVRRGRALPFLTGLGTSVPEDDSEYSPTTPTMAT